jgi:hypothetical protein
MEVLELNIFQPSQHNPEHVIVSLVPQTEGILAEVKSGRMAEVSTDGILKRGV